MDIGFIATIIALVGSVVLLVKTFNEYWHLKENNKKYSEEIKDLKKEIQRHKKLSHDLISECKSIKENNDFSASEIGAIYSSNLEKMKSNNLRKQATDVQLEIRKSNLLPELITKFGNILNSFIGLSSDYEKGIHKSIAYIRDNSINISKIIESLEKGKNLLVNASNTYSAKTNLSKTVGIRIHEVMLEIANNTPSHVKNSAIEQLTSESFNNGLNPIEKFIIYGYIVIIFADQYEHNPEFRDFLLEMPQPLKNKLINYFSALDERYSTSLRDKSWFELVMDKENYSKSNIA